MNTHWSVAHQGDRVRKFIMLGVSLLGLLVVNWGSQPASGSPNPADPFPGKPPITPRWAFEHWVWEDNTNTQSSTQNLVKGYLDRNIPVGAVIIDSPWETAYNNFVWDAGRYPNPQQMINDLHTKGVRVILWITGFVNQVDENGNRNPDYDFVKSRGYAVNNGQGFNWWKGYGVHIDFTNPNAKSWWHSKMESALNMGIDGWKVDMSADVLTDPVATSIGSISKADFKKYYYADLFDYSLSRNNQAISLARPYSSHQGGVGASISKLSIGWCGDFKGDFSGIASQKDNVYESALRGYGAPGIEVGGFSAPAPTKNSLIRYAQFGALTPLMENGGRNGGESQHLPWTWGSDAEAIYRYFATLHSELAPYQFSYGVEASLTGASILRGVDKSRSQHKLGEQVFVSVLTADTTSKQVTFPSGARWIDYWNEGQVYEGGSSINYSVPLNRYPIFLKAGAVLPMNVKNGITAHGNASSAGKITLQIYPYGVSSFTFHRPVGAGTGYSDVRINVDEARGTVAVSGSQAAAYRLRVKSFARPSAVSGADSWTYDSTAQTVIVDKQGQNFTVTINGLRGYTPASPTPTPPSGLITEMQVYDTLNASDWSIQADIQPGKLQFGDRNYTLTSIGGGLAGSDWIRAANDSKTYTGNPLVTFKVTGDADVYVAHSDRITTKPAWLSSANGWVDTGNDLTNSEPVTFSLYKKWFPANSTVSLGNNGHTVEGTYSIIVKRASPPGPTATFTVAPSPTATKTPIATSTPPPPPTGLITNMTVFDSSNASDWSIQADIQPGKLQFGDRNYTLTSIGGGLAGADWIRAANDSKTYTIDPLVTFKVAADADVYVAHNDRISPKPAWLSSANGWVDTGNDLTNSEPMTFSLYKKWFPANSTVSLGNNGSTTVGVYTVIAKRAGPVQIIADMTVLDAANAADWSIQANIQTGNLQYGDRNYTISTIGGGLAGSVWIRTANDSKTYTGDPLVTFRVLLDATVYVAHNDRITTKPAWLAGWTDIGNDLTNNEPRTFSLYQKWFPANSLVSLGNNGNIIEGQYIIIVK